MIRKKAIVSRRTAIKKLIKRHDIEDQGELIDLLEKEYDIETNQPAVSRDLHELGVRKGMVKGKLVYELARNVEQEMLRLAITDIVHNGTLLVIKTVPGLADFVGDFLDSQPNIGILGTIAGENMVFVAPEKTTKGIEKIFERVCAAMQFKKGKTKELKGKDKQ